MARTSRSARPLTDHEEIRQWAEERDARPSCVRRTGGNGDVGMIRLDFPGYSGEQSLEEISWDEWFEKFDESKLALIVQDETASGDRSNFNKLVGRETAAARERGERTSRHHPARGRTTSRKAGTRSSRSRRRTRSRGSESRNQSRRRNQGKSRKTRSTRSRAGTSGRTSARGRQSGRSRSSRRTASTRTRTNRSSGKNAQRSGTRTTTRVSGRKSPAGASDSRSSRRRRGEEAA